MDILKCRLLVGEPLQNSWNGLGSCNLQVTEQIYATIKACSINRKLCNFIDVVNTYLYWPKPDFFLFLIPFWPYTHLEFLLSACWFTGSLCYICATWPESVSAMLNFTHFCGDIFLLFFTCLEDLWQSEI